MLRNKYEDISKFEKKLCKLEHLCNVLKKARNKRERIRDGVFYNIIGKHEQEQDFRFADLVVKRLENRIKVITKQLTI